MAWSCSASSNSGLIKNLAAAHIIKSSAVKHAMQKVDRMNYSRLESEAYSDNPHGIGYGATISGLLLISHIAPHMHGYALEALEPYLKGKVLE
jgi:protein-L-isoaspartate(D-aspartate) O-methyltransferase